jgi:hypothetical protein
LMSTITDTLALELFLDIVPLKSLVFHICLYHASSHFKEEKRNSVRNVIQVPSVELMYSFLSCQERRGHWLSAAFFSNCPYSKSAYLSKTMALPYNSSLLILVDRQG